MNSSENSTQSLMPFNHPRFGQVRIVKDEHTGGPWFVAKDVAEALGYANPHEAVREHCKRVSKTLTPSTKGLQQTNIIPESDIYRLIIRSKLPSAEEFETWVMEDVLPTIRKHGGYLTPSKVEEALMDPDTLIRLATSLKEERAARKLAEAELVTAKPKAAVVDAVFAKRQDEAMKLTEIVRKMGGVNTMSIKNDLKRLGYLYKTYASYRVYAKFQKFFIERFSAYSTKGDIYATADGAALLTKLYYEKKLTMKKGA